METGIDYKLLIIGHKKWWTRQIGETYEAMIHKEEVIFCGRLDPVELNKVISSAAALTYVSYFEGFGIPILEAYFCETPVITSNVTSMPEVAGDAAIYVDPFSVRSICDGLIKVAMEPSLAATLNERARIQRQKFSWQKSADRLWSSMEKAINS
jgi:glycosyltransferase involved in cell wall biosynthesis